MGWTSTHVSKGHAGQYMKDLFTSDNENSSLEMLKGAFVGWGQHYAAVKRTIKATGESYVFAVATLIHWSRDEYNFTYKDMDESMGPCMYDCPESILKLLTPTEQMSKISGSSEKYSKAWRIACWETIFKKQDKKKLVNGTVIKLKKALDFVDGSKADTFVIIRKGRSVKLCGYEAGNNTARFYQRYNIRHFANYEYDIVGKVA